MKLKEIVEKGVESSYNEVVTTKLSQGRENNEDKRLIKRKEESLIDNGVLHGLEEIDFFAHMPFRDDDGSWEIPINIGNWNLRVYPGAVDVFDLGKYGAVGGACITIPPFNEEDYKRIGDLCKTAIKEKTDSDKIEMQGNITRNVHELGNGRVTPDYNFNGKLPEKHKNSRKGRIGFELGKLGNKSILMIVGSNEVENAINTTELEVMLCGTKGELIDNKRINNDSLRWVYQGGDYKDLPNTGSIIITDPLNPKYPFYAELNKVVEIQEAMFKTGRQIYFEDIPIDIPKKGKIRGSFMLIPEGDNLSLVQGA